MEVLCRPYCWDVFLSWLCIYRYRPRILPYIYYYYLQFRWLKSIIPEGIFQFCMLVSRILPRSHAGWWFEPCFPTTQDFHFLKLDLVRTSKAIQFNPLLARVCMEVSLYSSLLHRKRHPHCCLWMTAVSGRNTDIAAGSAEKDAVRGNPFWIL